MNSMRRLSILFALIVIMLAPSAAFAQQPGVSFKTTPPAPTGSPAVRLIHSSPWPPYGWCSLIDFEGIQNDTQVGTYFGPTTVQFGSSWLGLIDADAGGSGNIANEPSPETVAYFLNQDDISITFTPAVGGVGFKYSAAAWSLPITVAAYDISGNLISSASGSVVGTDYDGANCVGDPTGMFCLWDQISLVSGTADIRSVKISGAISNYFAIDNLYFCWDRGPLPTRASTWGGLKVRYR